MLELAIMFGLGFLLGTLFGISMMAIFAMNAAEDGMADIQFYNLVAKVRLFLEEVRAAQAVHKEIGILELDLVKVGLDLLTTKYILETKFGYRKNNYYGDVTSNKYALEFISTAWPTVILHYNKELGLLTLMEKEVK